MHLKCKYSRPDLDIDLYPSLLNKEVADAWYIYLKALFSENSGTRTSMIFGDTGLIYRVTYQGITTETEALSWNTLPGLLELKTLIESIIKQKLTVCIIQCYPNGKVGIGPHRDKEMVPGTIIDGLSIGATRTIEFTRQGYEPVRIKLPSGSNYVMNPPTNDKWLHSIIREGKIKECRFSCTFRNY